MMDGKSKIFVDGNCIVCDIEVSHYKKIAPEIFELVDISHPDFDATKFGLNAAAVNKHMHVLTPDGQLFVGVKAFEHIWSRIERYKFASKIINWPLINPAARIGYWIFAEIRPILPKKKR
jgi:predicted DCC family thiol-disulfide oxidoreductase YuxK